MIKLLSIKYIGMINIKILSLMSLAVFVFSDVVAAAGYVQVPGSKFIQQKQPSTIKAKFVEGEVLVKFKANVTTELQQYTATNLGGRSFKSVGKKLKVARVKLEQGSDVMTAVQAYQADANVEYAQPNYIYYASAIPPPDDASYGQLWGMNNTGQPILNPSYPTSNPGTSGKDIDAELAWDQITDCRNAVVAVLDTGINYTHTDLDGNMWDGSGYGYPNHGFDFVDNDDDPMPTGGSEHHGTHVAGTIGALGNNGLGVTGVCWRAHIMSVRVLDETGSGFTSDIIQGIEFASDNGARVINMSLGGEGPFDQLYSDAITYAGNLNVVVVVAAGNGDPDGLGDNNDGLGGDGLASTIVQPCNFTQDNLICVAALDQSYNLSSFSNHGATSVDVGAPGTNTLSSVAGRVITDDFASGWTLLGGAWTVSFCSPYNILSNPANWCGFGTYADNANDRIYKTFDLSGATAAELSFGVTIDTEPFWDSFSLVEKSSGGDPFSGGLTLFSASGSSGGLVGLRGPICNTSTCSLGFRLTSDGSIVDRGVAIVGFTIETLESNSTNYSVYNGTSMATPHVAGIATMVRAFNPNYTYTQTVEAIKNGGEVVAVLAGKTTTGRAANAMGAIAYITEPTGVAAVVQ